MGQQEEEAEELNDPQFFDQLLLLCVDLGHLEVLKDVVGDADEDEAHKDVDCDGLGRTVVLLDHHQRAAQQHEQRVDDLFALRLHKILLKLNVFLDYPDLDNRVE